MFFAVDKNLICQKPIVCAMRGRELAAWGPQDPLSLSLSLSFFLSLLLIFFMVGTDWEPTASFTLIGCCAHYWRGKLWKVCLPELFVLQHHNRTREGGGEGGGGGGEKVKAHWMNQSHSFTHHQWGFVCLLFSLLLGPTKAQALCVMSRLDRIRKPGKRERERE